MASDRVDVALVARGLCESIDRARALVMAGRIYIGERKALKPSEIVKEGISISVRGGKSHPYVSRGGLKLQHALDAFGINLENRICIDVGASTGGFTDVMLRAGARKVYAVDVAYGQLDYSIRSNPKVCVMERTNARFLTADSFAPNPPCFGATDVSFISLKAILPAALSVLTGNDRRFVALVKPQFEAQPEQVGERGVVRNPDVHRDVLIRITRFAQSIHWTPIGIGFSPITGPEGNIEFLLDLVPEETALKPIDEQHINEIVMAAYDKFVKSR